MNTTSGKRKPVLLFVDYAVPEYDRFAGSRTNFMYLKLLLEMGLDVKFISEDFRRIEPYSSELNQLGIETLDGDWYRDNWESWLRENGHGIDYVLLNKPDPASLFLPAVKSCTNAAVIYQCHDLHYLRLRRKAEVENDRAISEEADFYEKREDHIFANSDVLLTFSETEERILRNKFPDKKVFTVPLFFYDGVPEPDRDFSKRFDLLYVGACAHTPNLDAIKWFATEVFPLVLRKIPHVTFNVVGGDPPAEIQALHSERIRILGRVSDEELNALYDRVRMIVVPLRFGAGVKGKVIEAMYHGVPVVSTAIGLEGIKGAGELLTAHDGAADFAAEVVSLYRDQKRLRELSERETAFVSERFTASRTADLVTEILSSSRREAARRHAETVSAAEVQLPPRLIAFYLPQYHPIPENDEWWGEGFTEWRNVSKAQPLFPGHYQPHVPGDLGYYDLREPETREAQAEIARKYGIEGFCYYHYWFNGHRLLERPLAEVLESGKPDFPFCICWANENWTRRWDGEDQQILMQQKYSEEDDREHIRSLLPVFRDSRYIRVNGKPLFMVYRTENLPDPARTAEIWREEARAAGIGELYLGRVESISKSDPRDIGFDAGIEFAPDWWNKGPQLKADPRLFSQAKGRIGEVCNDNWIHSYQGLADAMMDKEAPAYKWFRCVTPSWDNWARRKDGANIFLGSNPEKYKHWLSRAIGETVTRHAGEERLVFINAWNEWAEGNHLEPDERFGYGYLEATRQALEENQLAMQARLPGAPDELRLGHYMAQAVNGEDRHDHLQRQLAQRDHKIEELVTSTSWRVTVPLRWAKRQAQNFKKLFRG